mmetsp:Transcript_12137/g.37183  ORF Transcript_12137/g.37183 Transcript_12137/m.37183 type:complete len:200 (-) Transcript_12137:571-1170(-)
MLSRNLSASERRNVLVSSAVAPCSNSWALSAASTAFVVTDSAPCPGRSVPPAHSRVAPALTSVRSRGSTPDPAGRVALASLAGAAPASPFTGHRGEAITSTARGCSTSRILVGPPTFVQKGVSKSCAAESRASGSLIKQWRSISANSSDHTSGFESTGGGADGILKRARSAGFSSQCGGLISASSMAVIPRDQMSAEDE